MPSAEPFRIRQLASEDVGLCRAMLAVMGRTFDEVDTYTAAQRGGDYLRWLLNDRYFIALAALDGDTVVGGLTAYELPKFEQARSEFYIYDLVVEESHRRRDVATSLINRLRTISATRGAWVIFVQADPADAPAVALYTGLGVREDVLHFDIAVD